MARIEKLWQLEEASRKVDKKLDISFTRPPWVVSYRDNLAVRAEEDIHQLDSDTLFALYQALVTYRFYPTKEVFKVYRFRVNLLSRNFDSPKDLKLPQDAVTSAIGTIMLAKGRWFDSGFSPDVGVPQVGLWSPWREEQSLR